jgi:hypothetical protein
MLVHLLIKTETFQPRTCGTLVVLHFLHWRYTQDAVVHLLGTGTQPSVLDRAVPYQSDKSRWAPFGWCRQRSVAALRHLPSGKLPQHDAQATFKNARMCISTLNKDDMGWNSPSQRHF